MKTLIVLFLILCLTIPALAQVQIYAPDGTYLGNVTNNPYDPNSISNPYGQYGSPYSSKSINNPYGKYGSPWSPQSPNSMVAPGAPMAPPLEPNPGVAPSPRRPDAVDSLGRGFELGRRLMGR